MLHFHIAHTPRYRVIDTFNQTFILMQNCPSALNDLDKILERKYLKTWGSKAILELALNNCPTI